MLDTLSALCCFVRDAFYDRLPEDNRVRVRDLSALYEPVRKEHEPDERNDRRRRDSEEWSVSCAGRSGYLFVPNAGRLVRIRRFLPVRSHVNIQQDVLYKSSANILSAGTTYADHLLYMVLTNMRDSVRIRFVTPFYHILCQFIPCYKTTNDGRQTNVRHSRVTAPVRRFHFHRGAMSFICTAFPSSPARHTPCISCIPCRVAFGNTILSGSGAGTTDQPIPDSLTLRPE